jgi:hypothetical protein
MGSNSPIKSISNHYDQYLNQSMAVEDHVNRQYNNNINNNYNNNNNNYNSNNNNSMPLNRANLNHSSY